MYVVHAVCMVWWADFCNAFRQPRGGTCVENLISQSKGVESLGCQRRHVKKGIHRNSQHAGVARSKIHLELAPFRAEDLAHSVGMKFFVHYQRCQTARLRKSLDGGVCEGAGAKQHKQQ